MTEQVKGGNQSTTTLKGLRVVTTYSITVRAYQDILGPVSNTISVQTYPGINNVIVRYNKFMQLLYQSIGQLSHPLLNLRTLNIVLIVTQLM